jgi:hypothetical protein
MLRQAIPDTTKPLSTRPVRVSREVLHESRTTVVSVEQRDRLRSWRESAVLSDMVLGKNSGNLQSRAGTSCGLPVVSVVYRDRCQRWRKISHFTNDTQMPGSVTDTTWTCSPSRSPDEPGEFPTLGSTPRYEGGALHPSRGEPLTSAAAIRSRAGRGHRCRAW